LKGLIRVIMQRKLTAILSADVVRYSGMMEADEAGTLDRLKTNRARIFDPHVTIHGGRVFKLIGDGALVEFPSVIGAVECALAIQEATEKAAQDLPEDRRIRYRIGINLGEVVVEGDDIYGEGVNVAARLQSLAPVGGVALSRVVKDQVEGKAKCAFDDLGEHTVKNIEKPVHVFAARPSAGTSAARAKTDAPRKLAVCVLPFANMSGDAEQEYFSDGISEDIITDLSKVSTLSVIARNTAFQFKGKSINVPEVARALNVSHILEGSVRKAGGRVRITAQLIDGTVGDHVWAERYDRELSDIFALQDEISEAIVAALKLKLVPEEKKAIEQRGTESVDAYNVYLMARTEYVAALAGDARRYEGLIRLCQRATEIDSGYARAWALMAVGQMWLNGVHGNARAGDGRAAAERALQIDAGLAEAHAVVSRVLIEDGNWEDAAKEADIALRLDPESHEVNRAAALMRFRQHRFPDAIRHFEKAAALVDTDFSSTGMLISAYAANGDTVNMRRAAEITLARVEKVLALDRNNASAMGHGSDALAVLGQSERAKEWMSRAVVVEPDNLLMRYNFACALAKHLGEKDAAIEMIKPVLEKSGASLVKHAKVDPDFDGIRNDPRFQAVIAAAEARLASETKG
jgi:adenylate cyclase